MTSVLMTVYVLMGGIYGEAGLMLNHKYEQDFSPKTFISMEVCREVALRVIKHKPNFIDEVNITCIPSSSYLDRDKE